MADHFVVNPYTGKAVQATEEQATTLAARGGQAISQHQAEELTAGQANNQWVDQNVSVPGQAAAGVFGGLTLGIGPAAMAALGLADRGRVSALQATPGYMAGDAVGMVAPALLSDGGSLAAEGAVAGAGEASGGVIARALGATPAGLMGGAGGLAERLAGVVAREAPGMGGVANSALRMAARGAAEGAVVSAAHTASDEVIQNHPLTWASIAASGANGALMGGLVGGALGGLTALPGAALDGVTSLSGQGSSKASASAGALRRLGMTAEEIGSLEAREGGIVGAAKNFDDVLRGRGESFASDTATINRVAREASADYSAAIRDVEQKLSSDFAAATPNTARVVDRIEQELSAKFGGELAEGKAQAFAARLRQEMDPLAPKVLEPIADGVAGISKPIRPEMPRGWNRQSRAANAKAVAEFDLEMAAYKEQVAAQTSARKAMVDGPGGTWDGWLKTSNRLQEMAGKGGLEGEMYRVASDAVQAEVMNSMRAADEGIAAVYGGAKANKALVDAMESATGRKAIAELVSNPMGITGHDVHTVAMGTALGSPGTGIGAVLGRKAIGFINNKLEAPLAEAAYRAAMGGSAAGATARIGMEITSAVKSFLTGSREVAVTESAKHSSKKGPSYSLKDYQKTLEAHEKLTSAVHRAQVQEVANQLANMGQPKLADAAMQHYDRAVAYLNQNAPKNPKIKQAGALQRLPIKGALDLKDMKFLRLFSAVSDPMSVVKGLQEGTVSRDAVRAMKYVYPDLHQELVSRTATQIMEMKDQGKFLPEDKVVYLATVLDAPVSSTTEKKFISAVQTAHAADNEQKPGPQPQSGGVVPMQSYQTPTQMIG
jgi:hypothetical protein